MSLTSEKNNGYLTGRPEYIFENISFSTSNNMNCFSQKFVERIQLTFEVYLLQNCVSFFNLYGKTSLARHTIGGNIIRRMRFSFSISKARATHVEYVMLITFPLPHLLEQRSSMLHKYRALIFSNRGDLFKIIFMFITHKCFYVFSYANF
jgi:hypothetical protein